MFVNRGMIEAAKTEGEVAGVMAHEISHVVLRHGTAQASKATKYEVGQVAGAIARRDHRRRMGPGRLAGHAVRPRHRVPAVRPRVREAGRHRGRADHGARRLRPARHGEHVQDDREAERIGRPAVAERPSRIPAIASTTSRRKRRRCASRTRFATRAASTRCRRTCEQLPPAPTTEEATKNAGGPLDRHVAGATAARPTGRVEPPVVAVTGPTTKATCSGSACRRTGASSRANSSVTFAPDGAYGEYNGRACSRTASRSGWRATSRTTCRTRPTSSFSSLAAAAIPI